MCALAGAPIDDTIGDSRSDAGKTTRRFRLFSGLRGEIKAAAVEVDRVNEVLSVPKPARRVFHPLDLGVDRLAAGVGNAVSEIRDDVLEAPLEHTSHLNHRLQ